MYVNLAESYTLYKVTSDSVTDTCHTYFSLQQFGNSLVTILSKSYMHMYTHCKNRSSDK